MRLGQRAVARPSGSSRSGRRRRRSRRSRARGCACMPAMKASGADAGLLGGEHDRRAVGVVGADEVHRVAGHALRAHPDVGLDVADQVARGAAARWRRAGRRKRQLAGHGGPARVKQPAIIARRACRSPTQASRTGMQLAKCGAGLRHHGRPSAARGTTAIAAPCCQRIQVCVRPSSRSPCSRGLPASCRRRSA